MSFTDAEIAEEIETASGGSPWERTAEMAYRLRLNALAAERDGRRLERGSLPTIACAFCGSAAVRRKGARFCSIPCAHRFNNKRRRALGLPTGGKRPPRETKAKVRLCRVCSRSLPPQTAGAGRPRLYCSARCAGRARSF